ncbi:uncharacterized protein VTP21DRAFT_2893 [Calcarisporiella thermophila]|uniref:uncharacterized protein n=1 Tax=Calcarisporiella thermophila TaxID=911321 RepID=UPI00374451B1
MTLEHHSALNNGNQNHPPDISLPATLKTISGTSNKSPTLNSEVRWHSLNNEKEGRVACVAQAPRLLDLAKVEEEVYALALSDKPIAGRVREALFIIEEAVRRYGVDGLIISFNGGKDCTVLLHLFAAVLYRLHGSNIEFIHGLYVTHPNQFDEVESFVKETVQRYGLDLVRIPGPMKPALQRYFEARPGIKAVLVGTRRNDPHGKHLTAFVPTDEDWPSCMRVHPIVDWQYQQIWEFLLTLRVPYCKLYDLGYTSLGGTDNTEPNPDLRNPGMACGYSPAYCLVDECKERDGRRCGK